MLRLIYTKSFREISRCIYEAVDHGILDQSNLCHYGIGSHADESEDRKEAYLFRKGQYPF